MQQTLATLHQHQEMHTYVIICCYIPAIARRINGAKRAARPLLLPSRLAVEMH